jgi:MFS superfamily sulfate permease-like transporter
MELTVTRVTPKAASSTEKPENGIKGLKHWRHDLVAGLIVSLVSVPLSLGIAIASGAPPVCGLISAIIAGLVFPLLGGAYCTISGPAAGLAPAVMACIMVLGKGNMEYGYTLVLGVITMAGIVQLILSQMKAARFSAMFPVIAVEAMLASIGLMIIAKQIPALVGHKGHAHEFFGLMAEAPSNLMQSNASVLFIGVVCLLILFSFPKLLAKTKLRMVPPQLIAVVVGAILAQVLNIDPKFLINIPADPLKHGILMPNFVGLFSDPGMWWTIAGCVLTLTLIDGFESLATIMAVDRIDPFHRKSNPDRTLFAMGMSNICSSLAGGLTIIPGGIKSTTNILSGGKTLWANFYNACFLICYLLVARECINMIPLAALAAVLIHIGYKLCEPKKWFYAASVGKEQLFLFASTIAVTLYTDLLWGLIYGMAAKLVMAWVYSLSSTLERHHGHGPVTVKTLWVEFVKLFRNPVTMHDTQDGVHKIRFNGPVVCFNALHVQKELEKIPANCTQLKLIFAPSVGLVDHTSASNILAFQSECHRTGKLEVEITGLELLRMHSKDASCMRHAHLNGWQHRRHA